MTVKLPEYMGLLVASDGSYVTDYQSNSVVEVWEKDSNSGSRWFFYPFHFVIRYKGGHNHWRVDDNARIVDAPDYPPQLHDLKGKTIKTARQFIIDNIDELVEFMQ
jgi:hypothetical protein